MVTATLVTSVTLAAAGLTLPGAFISSAPDLRVAALVNRVNFTVFLLFNNIAMSSSMVTCNGSYLGTNRVRPGHEEANVIAYPTSTAESPGTDIELIQHGEKHSFRACGGATAETAEIIDETTEASSSAEIFDVDKIIDVDEIIYLDDELWNSSKNHLSVTMLI
ncbi:PGG domain [Arabidopsis thaliana x Arabidopsis arenosa]|uniref:PGG domain n=1 Tax=Arabidopsis thaliana x Arabidopsis arenosa TaxID=1240361 RepID=A0A8T2ACB6_9BRAS|nr:PGG domain [Arabidopsis thaliana x Arabidopsis arenosa]